MPKSSIEDLVEAAQDRLPSEPIEDVTHDLFEIVENDPALLRECQASSGLSSRANVNPTIAFWVKKAGRSTFSGGHPSTRSRLIKTFSRLV